MMQIAITLHTALSHLDKRNTNVRMLFIDYSSAFNTIVPFKLIIKLGVQGLNPAVCYWVLDVLMYCSQVVKVGNTTSTTLILKIGAPQWCQPPPVFPVHPRLSGHARLQLNHQVCRRHYSGRLDYQQRRDGLCHQKHSQTFTDAQSRASCQAVSPPGTATALPTTVRLSRG